MINTKKGITEVKAILEAMNFFNKISVGSPIDLPSEKIFPSAYIAFDSDINQPNNQMVSNGGEYDRILLITIVVALDLTNEDDLYYLDVRDRIEEAILRDTTIWDSVVDRDVLGSVWDVGQNYPRRQGEVALRLFTRSCVD